MRQGKPARSDSAALEDEPAVDVPFVLAGLLVIFAAVLGGASRENPLRLAAVELCALPVAALALRRLVAGEGAAREAIAPLGLLCLIIGVPLLQQIPLPPAWWTRLPGQAPRAQALALAHLPRPWLPISLSPSDTAATSLALIPPAAMLLVTPGLSLSQARRLGGLWIALAVAGLILGVAQITAPAESPAYPYRTTNVGSLVGLFANRNHEAGFLLALLPLAAALALPEARRRPGRRASRRAGAIGPWLAGLFIVMSVVALGVIRSRAGVILATPAVLAALAVLWRGAPRRLGWRPAAGVAGAVVLAALAVALFGLGPILDRFGPQTTGEFRFERWPYVEAAAGSYLPLGAGLGSFNRVFQSVEPLTLVAPTYFNHAHNDYLELWLETGWVGVAILALFTVWLVRATYGAWRRGSGLARAASAAILLIMAESVVDYPLRTESLMVLLAFCCGLLANAESMGRSEAMGRDEAGKAEGARKMARP